MKNIGYQEQKPYFKGKYLIKYWKYGLNDPWYIVSSFEMNYGIQWLLNFTWTFWHICHWKMVLMFPHIEFGHCKGFTNL